MYDHDFFPFFGMHFGPGWVFMMLFWVLVIVGVIALVRWPSVTVSGRNSDISRIVHRTHVDILRERYARGEIEREEFLRRLEGLKKLEVPKKPTPINYYYAQY